MKSMLEFYNQDTLTLSECSNSLNIESSSKNLNWKGIILEKGYSMTFYTNETFTKYFFFSLALENELSWEVKQKNKCEQLITKPGEIWINPPNTPFTHCVSTRNDFIILAIEKDTLLSSLEYSISGIEDKLLFLTNYNICDEVLKNIISLFYLEVLNNGNNGLIYTNNLLKILSSHYINNYSNFSDINSQKTISVINDDDVIQIENYVMKNIEKNISIEEIAFYVNMSKFYFLKEYKLKTGKTPYRYILDMKIEYSKKLLENSKLSITDIVYKCGFSDQSHFGKVFKKKYGVTPRDFRLKKFK